MQEKKNRGIQLIRIVAMLMITFDHILAYIEFPMKSMVIQVTNSGVFIFLFLSGWLYGNKYVENWRKWFISRILRICVPMWIFMLVDFIVEAIVWNTFEIKLVFNYLFNLQGIFGVNTTGASLWFLTLLMICYFMTPLLQWIRRKKIRKEVGNLAIICVIVIQIVCAYISDIGMVSNHTISWCIVAVAMYVIGYYCGAYVLPRKINCTRILCVTVIVVITTVIVMIFRRFYDGHIIYDRIVINYGMLSIDIWICTVIMKVSEYINRDYQIKILDYLDSITYDIYIVHCLIIMVVTVNLIQPFGSVIYVVVSLMLSWLAAVILHNISGKVIKVLMKRQ